jgi:hypothetical protein
LSFEQGPIQEQKRTEHWRTAMATNLVNARASMSEALRIPLS